MTTETHPQVALFGSITGGWRESFIIPVLQELGVTYFNPVIAGRGWTPEDGIREAEVMAHAETVVMVYNQHSPAFGGLVESGWAAVNTLQRGQTLILLIEGLYRMDVPRWLRWLPPVRALIDMVDEYALRARVLVQEHARRVAATNDRVILAEDMAGVLAALRRIYAPNSIDD